MVSVNVYPVDQDGSANYRLIYPAQAMISQGLDVQICRTGEETRDCDVAVLNRPVRQIQAEAIEQLVAMGKRVVLDMDDALDWIPTTHSMFPINTEHLHRACKSASLVTCSTPALTELYGYGANVVWRNSVPSWYFDTKPGYRHEKQWVMWYGTVGSHPEDLQTTNGQVAKAMDETDAELSFIGPKHQGVQVSKLLKWRGKIQLAGWFNSQHLLMSAIASATVGIVPLADSRFNSAKSSLKMQEFASVGVPVVAAATEENVRLHELGVGLIAKYPKDWYRQVKKLLTDEDYRYEVSLRGLGVMKTLTVEQSAKQLYDAWTVDSI